MFASGDMVLHGAVFDATMTVLASATAMSLASLTPFIVMTAQTAFANLAFAVRQPLFFAPLLVADMLALGLRVIAPGDRLLTRVVSMLAGLAAADVHAMMGVAVMLPAEPVAVLHGVVVSVMVLGIVVRLGVLGMVRAVVLESGMRGMVLVPLRPVLMLGLVTWVVHLMMLGAAHVARMRFVVCRRVTLLLVLFLHGGDILSCLSLFR